MSLDLRQAILLVYLLVATAPRTSAAFRNDEHDGLEPGTLQELHGPHLRMRRQSSAVANGNKTGTGQSPQCNGSTFQCSNGTCLSRFFLCDGTPDCPTGNDEKDCVGCKPDQFRCGDGECIAKVKRCDGTVDCTRGSDEREPCCNANEFECHNGTCIKGDLRCNGNVECSDSSDEYNCDLSGSQFMSSSQSMNSVSSLHAGWILLLAMGFLLLLTPYLDLA